MCERTRGGRLGVWTYGRLRDAVRSHVRAFPSTAPDAHVLLCPHLAGNVGSPCALERGQSTAERMAHWKALPPRCVVHTPLSGAHSPPPSTPLQTPADWESHECAQSHRGTPHRTKSMCPHGCAPLGVEGGRCRRDEQGSQRRVSVRQRGRAMAALQASEVWPVRPRRQRGERASGSALRDHAAGP